MKRIITLFGTGFIASLMLISGKAFADPAQLISGPTGTIVNGWYTDHPTVTVQAVCGGSPYGNVFSVDIAGWSWSGSGTPEQSLPGRHYVELLSNDNSNIYINNDGTLSPYLAGGCSNPDGSSPTTVLWQGYIQWDTTSPTISITSPSNNTNLASNDSTTTVTGNVSDTGSGIQSVTVNGVKASVSGSTFTASINISYGLNTISAIATSNSGATTTSQSISVFRYENASSGSGTSGTTSNKPTIGTITKPTTGTPTNTTPSGNSTNNNANNKTVSSPVSTPVKVAGGVGAAGAVGIGAASWLGYIPYKRIGLFVGKVFLK